MDIQACCQSCHWCPHGCPIQHSQHPLSPPPPHHCSDGFQWGSALLISRALNPDGSASGSSGDSGNPGRGLGLGIVRALLACTWAAAGAATAGDGRTGEVWAGVDAAEAAAGGSAEVWEGVDEPGALAQQGAAGGCGAAVSPVAARPGAQRVDGVDGVDSVKCVGCADADAAGAAPPPLCAAAVAGPAFEESAAPLRPVANVKL